MEFMEVTITSHKEHFTMYDVFSYIVRMAGCTFTGALFIDYPMDRNPLSLCYVACEDVQKRARDIAGHATAR